MTKTITYTISAFLWVYALALGAEFYLVAKKYRQNQATNNPSFTTQYLHPHYFFSFPRDPEILKQINSDDFWVDQRGFRGEGPEAKGKRKLAFLLGGSTAFGEGVQKNSETITARLNELQQEYFFVNTGVPSWNSYQELLRLIKQCLPERPSLVISLSGFNDFYVGIENFQNNLPIDTPESFAFLENYVEDIRSDRIKTGWLGNFLYEKLAVENILLSNLRNLLRKQEAYSHEAPSQLPAELIQKTAAGYIDNLKLMHDISSLHQIQFVSFFQPVAPLHPSLRTARSWESVEYGKFQREVKSRAPQFLVDISAPFQKLPEVDHLFVDDVHFNKDGYLEVAKLILQSLKQRKIIRTGQD